MSKVKVKQVKKMVVDGGLNTMMEEMMGMKDAEPEIIIPKFVTVRNTIRYICKVLNQFSTFGPLRNDFPEIAQGLDEIKAFSDEVKDATYLKHDHDEKESQYASISKEDINGLYRKLKDNSHVKRLIVLCNLLDKYKVNFTDPAKLQENFVNQEPGLSFKIFDFSSLDLKVLWSYQKLNSIVKRYILSVLAALHKNTYLLYTTITSPDVDIDKFTELLLSSIQELKKHPDLHRCNAAFKRIEQSVELLKGKFSDYYRESLASRNPDSLVTSFIVDVSNQGGADARLTREFRQIIQYMHKISQKSGKSKDPQVQKIFAMLNSNFSLMEKHTKGKDDKDTLAVPEADLTKDDEAPAASAEEIAEEKKTKRLEKQRAKKKKKRTAKKSSKDATAEQDNDGDTDAADVDTENVTVEDNKAEGGTLDVSGASEINGNPLDTYTTPEGDLPTASLNELEKLILQKQD